MMTASKVLFPDTPAGQVLAEVTALINTPRVIDANRVAEVLCMEANGYKANARATRTSHKDEETGEYVLDPGFVVEVKDPTAPSGVRLFHVTVEEVDV